MNLSLSKGSTLHATEGPHYKRTDVINCLSPPEMSEYFGGRCGNSFISDSTK